MRTARSAWTLAATLVLVLSAGCAVFSAPAPTATNLPPTFTPSPTQPAWDNLALLPPMGWNSFNHFGCDVDEELIRETADAMVASGMQSAGYRYVNIDDCWMARERDADGNLVPDPVKFPGGMKALADYVHDRGLRLGIYLDRGWETCGHYPGSYGYEEQDAGKLAEWGVDLLKYDNCAPVGRMVEDYTKMSNILKATGRPIFFSMCNWGFPGYWVVGSDVAHMWRTTSDIKDNWDSVMKIMDANNVYADFAGPGHWNDPDMLEVGNGGMTNTEYRAHFGMWALMAAPLIAGNDLRAMDAETLAILTPPEVIAINQDPLGHQGRQISRLTGNSQPEVWAKKLSGGNAWAVALLNRSGETQEIAVQWDDLGLPAGSATVRDLWDRADRGVYRGAFSATVPSHGLVLVKIVSVAETAAATPES